MKVVIIEFIDEFHAFLAFLQKENLKLEDFTIIALEPRLQAYLKKRGINYRNTLPYFNNESHKKIIVETEKIMKHIRDNFKFIDSNGLKNCYETEFSHHVRFYLNHMFKMLEVLENIYVENNNYEIFAYGKERFVSSGMITDMERYIGILAEYFAKERNLKFTNFNESCSSHELQKKDKKRWEFIEKVVKKIMLSFLRKKQVIFIPRIGNVFNNMIKQLSKRNNKISFLAIDYTGGLLVMSIFNLISLVKSILKVGAHKNCYLVNMNFFHRIVKKEEQQKLMECIDFIISTQYEFLYKYNGISYYELLKKKINIGLKGHIFQILLHSHNLKYLFEKFSKKIIMSYYALGIMGVAGEMSRRMGIRSLFISHGAHPVPVDSYHEIELSNLCKGFLLSEYTHVALSTPVQEAHLHYFKQKYKWVQNHEVRTGPLIFTNLNGVNKSLYKAKLGFLLNDIVLTYATTTKYRHGERFYFIETLDEFIASLTDIVNTVNKNKNVLLIIRIHPGFHLTDKEIKTLLPASKRIIFHREGSFSEALAVTDMLISYSSTTIDEALINRIPVLLYDKWNRYNHFKTGVFDNPQSPGIFPVCYVNDYSKLDTALQYMTKKLKETRREDIDVSRYCYDEDYSNNFHDFIEKSL